MKKIAVFDIDGTLLKGNSTEKIFIIYLLKNRLIKLKGLLLFLLQFIVHLPFDLTLAIRANKFYIAGQNRQDILKQTKQFFFKEIVPRIPHTALHKIRYLKDTGYEIVLLSGIPDLLIREYQKYLSAEKAFGTPLEIHNGTYSGRLSGLHPYGKIKAHIIKEYHKKSPIDFQSSYAFADRGSDAFLLELFGKPTAVNPNKKLLTVAIKNGWKIEYFD